MEHRMLGMETEVGEQDHAAVAHVVTQRLGQSHGRSGYPGAARPGERSHRAPPCSRGRSAQQGRWVDLAPADRVGARGEGGDQLVTGEGGGQDTGRAQLQPVPHRPPVVDDQHRALCRSGGREQVAVVRGKAGIGDQGRERPARRQSGAYFLGGDAADELGGEGAAVGPQPDGAEPRRPGRGQAEDDEALGCHQGLAGR